MTEQNRIASIDIMRAIAIILMLFVNDLNMTGLPEWLGNRGADTDGLGLADWVLTAFLFITGLAIPFSISKKISSGLSTIDISKQIMKRSISLIIIGVLMLNSGRVNEEFTGIGKNLWAILMYLGVFLIWNNYKENDRNFFTIAGMKLSGIALLVFLVYKFRSGEFENNGSLITGWWGVLGMIGWGYLVSAFVYLLIRDSILNTTVAFLFFLTLNIMSNLDLMNYLNPVKPVLGVILDGSVPMIVLSGMLTAIIIKTYSATDLRKQIVTIVTIGIASIAAGFILRNWFTISKIDASPSWGLICNGISILLFGLLYLIVNIKKQDRWASFLRPAGENSLTAYLAPEILYYTIWSTGIPVLIYKQSGVPAVAIAGSLAWAFLMVGLTSLLVRYNIRLKI